MLAGVVGGEICPCHLICRWVIMKNKKSTILERKQNEMIERALAFHHKGRLDEAAAQYEKLLDIVPDNVVALTNLGTIALQKGELEDGVRMIGQSLELAPDQPEALNNLGSALRRLKRWNEALASYERAIALSPNFAGAHINLGHALMEVNLWDEALASYDRASAIDPNLADSWLYRGNVFRELERWDEALDSYDRALAINPDFAEVWFNRGNAFCDLNNPQEALISYGRATAINPNFSDVWFSRAKIFATLQLLDEALGNYDCFVALQPDFATGWSNRGNILLALKRWNEALASYNRAIDLDANFAGAWWNRGNVLQGLKRLDEALASCDRAIGIDKNFIEAWFSRGNILRDLKRYDEALAGCDRAIALNPDYAEAWCSRGNVLSCLKRDDEALASYNRAIAINPDFAEAWFNRGLIFFKGLEHLDEMFVSYDRAITIKPDLSKAWWAKALAKLLIGEYQQGWQLYEWRWKTESLSPLLAIFPQPLWLGEQPLTNKTLLIHAEQGLGDYIQFIRYASLAQQQGANVILQVPIELMAIISTLKGQFTLINREQPLPDFDYHCPVMSLPLAFKTRVETIPAEIPYLFSEPTKQAVWQQHLGEKSSYRVGLVWSGATIHRNDESRSIPLKQLESLLALPVEFHSLQKEIRPEDAAFMVQNGRIKNHQDLLHDFSDTAALIEAMDLVISVDTSVVHLAGALGKKVWVLLAYVPDFRWLLNREDSPWYPTATLFRQSLEGDWDTVINKVINAVEEQAAIDKTD